MNVLRFLRDTRAGATAIAAAAVTVMSVGGAALIGDHAWLIDQRDVPKTATDAATVATTIEMNAMRNASVPDSGGRRVRMRATGLSHRESWRAGSERLTRKAKDERRLDDRAVVGSP